MKHLIIITKLKLIFVDETDYVSCDVLSFYSFSSPALRTAQFTLGTQDKYKFIGAWRGESPLSFSNVDCVTTICSLPGFIPKTLDRTNKFCLK